MKKQIKELKKEIETLKQEVLALKLLQSGTHNHYHYYTLPQPVSTPTSPYPPFVVTCQALGIPQ